MLELSLREALRFKHRRIDTGHLLLAVVRLDPQRRTRARRARSVRRRRVRPVDAASWPTDRSDERDRRPSRWRSSQRIGRRPSRDRPSRHGARDGSRSRRTELVHKARAEAVCRASRLRAS